MSDLILFCLAATGMTLILVQGSIFEPFRVAVARGVVRVERKREKGNLPPGFTFVEFVHKMLQCVQCTGFWCGLLCGFFLLPTGVYVAGADHTFVISPLKIFYSFVALICYGAAGSFLAPFGDLILQWIYVSKEIAAKNLIQENQPQTNDTQQNNITSRELESEIEQ
jgi:hypothetical protein